MPSLLSSSSSLVLSSSSSRMTKMLTKTHLLRSRSSQHQTTMAMAMAMSLHQQQDILRGRYSAISTQHYTSTAAHDDNHMKADPRRRSFSSTSSSSTKVTPPAPAKQPWLETSPTYQYYQNGMFVDSMGEAAHPVRNPATDEIVGMVPELSNAEFNTAVQLAQEAFDDEWKHVPVTQRQRYMLKFQQSIRDHMDDLAYLISLENGKTLADARGDVTRGLEMVESACWMAPQLLGDSMAGLSTTLDCVSYREPLGVVAGICPFNFPAMSKYIQKYSVVDEGVNMVFLVHPLTD